MYLYLRLQKYCITICIFSSISFYEVAILKIKKCSIWWNYIHMIHWTWSSMRNLVKMLLSFSISCDKFFVIHFFLYIHTNQGWQFQVHCGHFHRTCKYFISCMMHLQKEKFKKENHQNDTLLFFHLFHINETLQFLTKLELTLWHSNILIYCYCNCSFKYRMERDLHHYKKLWIVFFTLKSDFHALEMFWNELQSTLTESVEGGVHLENQTGWLLAWFFTRKLEQFIGIFTFGVGTTTSNSSAISHQCLPNSSTLLRSLFLRLAADSPRYVKHFPNCQNLQI